MISRTIFRLLVVLFVTAAIAAMMVDQVFPSEELQALSQFIAQRGTSLLDAAVFSDAALFALTILLLMWVSATVVGLFLFWNPARTLYSLGYLSLLSITLLFDSSGITSSLSVLLANLASVLGGFILCSIYFTNVRHFFIGERRIWS